MPELSSWLERMIATQSNEEVFAILDEFRPLLWSDDERASMAKIYNAKLHQIRMNQEIDNGKRLEKPAKRKASPLFANKMLEINVENHHP